eukprot:4311793-Heterocapsa_arctica.AAC.1
MVEALDHSLGYEGNPLAHYDLLSRAKHMFRGGYRLPRLRKVLCDHRLRCDSLWPGDTLIRLDASSWAFRMSDDRTWISSTTSVKILSILDPQTGNIL